MAKQVTVQLPGPSWGPALPSPCGFRTGFQDLQVPANPGPHVVLGVPEEESVFLSSLVLNLLVHTSVGSWRRVVGDSQSFSYAGLTS